MKTLQQLVRQAQSHTVGSTEFHRAVVQNIIEQIGSTRASIWYFNEYQDSLTCEVLFDRRTEEYSSSFSLYLEDYPQYFGAMVHGDTICAPDALRHLLTSCFAEMYFDPLEIKSLLDVSIIIKGKVVGVICCEHCEHRKDWTGSEIEYLNTVASMLSLTVPLLMVEA